MPSGDDRRNEIVSGISGSSVGWDVDDCARPGGGSAAGADARRVSLVDRAAMIWRIAARSWLRMAAWTSPSYGSCGGAAAYGGATGAAGAATGAPRPGGRPGGGPGGGPAGGGA